MCYEKNTETTTAAVALCCCLLLAAGCSKRETAGAPQQESGTPQTSAMSAAGSSPIDACSLLTSDEIQTVQGEAVKEPKSEQKMQGGLRFSQCYFTLPTFSNSISLTLVQNGAIAGAGTALQSWNEKFSPAQLQGAETEGGKKKLPPRRVADLGDEAFWVGNEIIGALHVLEAGRYLSISVGGVGSQEIKLEKGSELARRALARLKQSP